MESAVVLLPQPDSPTIASVSRGRSQSDTSSTAWTFRSPTENTVVRPSTSSTFAVRAGRDRVA